MACSGYYSSILRAAPTMSHAPDGVDFVEVCQDELSVSDPLREFSSPTLLVDNEIIFGSRVSGLGGGCSLKLPTDAELLEAIKKR